MVSTSFSLKDLVPMIFCCSKDLADELGICIVDMGLVGARDLGGLVRLRRSPISKESPKTSSSSYKDYEEDNDDLTLEASRR